MPKLTEVVCRECGSKQLEPEAAVSTFCRGCGAHIEIGVARPEPSRRSRRVEDLRRVHCYRCGTEHEVSMHAKSTLCPGCASSIETGDRVISSNTSKPVDLRGTLTIEPNATLTASRIICTDAKIHGAITGTILCENRLAIGSTRRQALSIYTGALEVLKGAAVVLAFPAVAASADIRGQLAASVFVNGPVVIRKGARLEGELHARSLLVERGGGIEAVVRLGPNEPAMAPALPAQLMTHAV